MPRHYDKLGVRFQYPDNWELDEGDAARGQTSITVYAPGGAFWSLAAHPPGADPQEITAAAEQTMRQEYPELDAEPVVQQVDGHELLGADFNFIYLDLTNTCQIRCLRSPSATYVVFTQAEDRDFAQVEKIFEAMTVSFLRETVGTD